MPCHQCPESSDNRQTEESVEAVLALAEGEPFTALHAGYVENGEKKVVISPLNITYHGDEFKLRS